MALFKCKMCGGELEISNEMSVVTCEYCGTKQTLPKLDDEKRAMLYDRANHFRRNNEFDKAMDIYEQILNEDNTDAEAYWSLVLCRFGVEYIIDPPTNKRVPTINRTQFTSIYDDENYKSALQYADYFQKVIYEEEAKIINDIQKGILSISQQEEPFDVFICYKETDDRGRRTIDSVLAYDLYQQLTGEGLKVFFSRVTLEDKLGSNYEAYIFAALNSAKVMVVLGTRPEYFNAAWVRNEWSRYLALIKSGEKKVLIPAYKDIDPYSLPKEFALLQAQDMSKLGFMQDMIRGIKKILHVDEPKIVVQEIKSNTSDEVSNLYVLARRERDNNSYAESCQYYKTILSKDPMSWEAAFYSLVFEHIGKNLSEVERSCTRILNGLSSVISLVEQTVDNPTERKKAYDDIARFTIWATRNIDAVMQSNEASFRTRRANILQTLINIVYGCANDLRRLPEKENYTNAVVDSIKQGVSLQSKLINEYSQYNNDTERRNFNNWANEVKKHDSSYVIPAIPAQTSAQIEQERQEREAAEREKQRLQQYNEKLRKAKQLEEEAELNKKLEKKSKFTSIIGGIIGFVIVIAAVVLFLKFFPLIIGWLVNNLLGGIGKLLGL